MVIEIRVVAHPMWRKYSLGERLLGGYTGVKTESFSCKIRNYMRMPIFALLLNIVDILTRIIRQERKDIQIGKEEVNITLFAYDMIFFSRFYLLER